MVRRRLIRSFLSQLPAWLRSDCSAATDPRSVSCTLRTAAASAPGRRSLPASPLPFTGNLPSPRPGGRLPWHAEVIRDEDDTLYVREWHAVDCGEFQDVLAAISGE